MTVLKVENLCKSFENTNKKNNVVNGLSFSLNKGECYGLLGPNGAGKTTTLKICLGLIKPDSGSVKLMNFDLSTHSQEARKHIGVVPQIDSLDPDFSVAENISVYGSYFGVSKKVISDRLDWLLEFSNLTKKRNSKISELSGGMKRRLTLARALVNNPDLILMDEPTTGLDPQARHIIWERLKTLLSQNKTILLTTHFMDEAERLCNRLGVIDNGTLVAEGEPKKLILDHIEPQVFEVFGEKSKDWAYHQKELSNRIEFCGETVFFYAKYAEPVLKSLILQKKLRYIHRPANLEDLFLKITGREMRD